MSDHVSPKRSYGYLGSQSETPSRASSRPPRRSGWLSWLGWLLLAPFRWLKKLLGYVFHPGRRGPRRDKTPKKSGWRRLRRFAMWTVIFGLISSGLLILWVSSDLPDPDKLTERQYSQSTKIYDRTGEHLLYEIFTDEKRTLVELKDIPPALVNGVIATEDKKFYEHNGIRPLSLARSIVYGLLGKGRIGGGASTLTQQLVKNAIVGDERRGLGGITRKVKEMVMSVWLEQKYTKDQILKIYFNEIPYGSTNYGVQAAAQSYFGKSVTDLNLSESATLAGLPQQPSVFLNNPEALRNRRNLVLQRMVEEGYLSSEEAEKTKAEPITLKRQVNSIQAPHFVLYVKEQLVKQYGESMVEKGGLKVITTLDWDKQQAAEKAVSSTTKIFAEANANNAALVSIDPRSGQILAMIGSRDFFDESISGQFNVATLGRRQPGSSIKPIVYAAAFERGLTPSTMIYDVVTPFPGGGQAYTPHNYDLSERGPVTLRQALQGSLNIPAVKTMYIVGLKQTLEFAERMGYTTFNSGLGLSLVLGGGEVSMIEHTNAYATFANNGKRLPVSTILRVEGPNKDTIFEWKQPEGEQVIDAKLAATMSNVLSDDASRQYVFGANSNLTLPGRPVAAKTGTTNNYVDAWTVGYTPSIATVVWAGNTDNKPMKAGYGGNKVAGEIWNQFMREALKNTPAEQFPAMTVPTSTKPILNGSAGGNIKLLVNSVTGRLANSSTPPEYIQEKTFIIPHDILHYIDVNNPTGPVPEHPESNPAYAIWEKAVQDWIVRNKAKNPDWNPEFTEPPTEYDDAYSLELMPKLEVRSPQPDSILTSRQINTDIVVSAVRGVTRVSYQIDGAYVGVVSEHPFNLSYEAATLTPGKHTLTITVEDDVGNKLRRDVPFTLEVAAAQPGVQFTRNPATIITTQFPLGLFLTPHRLGEISAVKLSAISANRTQTIAIGSANLNNLQNNELFLNWTTAPAPGPWSVVAEVTLKNGTVYDSDQFTLLVN